MGVCDTLWETSVLWRERECEGVALLMEARRLWTRMSPNSAQTYPMRRGEHRRPGQKLTRQFVVISIHEEHRSSTQVRSSRAQDLHQARQLDESQSDSTAAKE